MPFIIVAVDLEFEAGSTTVRTWPSPLLLDGMRSSEMRTDATTSGKVLVYGNVTDAQYIEIKKIIGLVDFTLIDLANVPLNPTDLISLAANYLTSSLTANSYCFPTSDLSGTNFVNDYYQRLIRRGKLRDLLGKDDLIALTDTASGMKLSAIQTKLGAIGVDITKIKSTTTADQMIIESLKSTNQVLK